MAQTVVFGCDWCGEIVPTRPTGAGEFAAKITAEKLPLIAARQPDVYRICGDCEKAFKALTKGKFRRVG